MAHADVLDFATTSLDYRRGALNLLSRMSADSVAVTGDVDQARLDQQLSREDHTELRRRVKLAQDHLDAASKLLFTSMEPSDSPPSPVLTLAANTDGDAPGPVAA